jgi:hypothetical protein
MRVALKMSDRREVLRLLAPYTDAAIAEAKKKKRRKPQAKKRAFSYGVYGGWFYPGYHNDSGSDSSSGSDGGESVNENTEDIESVVQRFAASCARYLGIENPPRIQLRRDPEWTRRNGTFGRYTAEPDHRIELATAGRHIVDILRTLAHEMTHAQQNERVGLPDHAGETGSEFENDANARAGEIMRHWAEQEPELFQNVPLEESSGYIPTQAEKDDPRFLMALTQDIRPGETGRQANRLGLQTDSQGRPALLMKRLENLLESVKTDEGCWSGYRQQGMKRKGDRMVPNCVPVSEDQELVEVAMSPGALKSWAKSPAAQGIRVGVEYELIFPDVREDGDSNFEPDYDADERAYDIDGIIEFFQGGDNGLRPRGAARLKEQLQERFYEWLAESFDNDFDQAQFEDWCMTNIWPEEEDNYMDRARQALADEDDEDEIQDRARFLFQEEIEQQWEDQGRWYGQARDELYDDYLQNADQEDWLRSEGLRYMSDVSNEYSLDWPYYTDVSDDDDVDWQSWADEIADVVDMPVTVGRGYHSTRRGEDRWIMEPDSSLTAGSDDDAGMELISPPLPLPEALEMMQRIAAWAKRRGVYTNSTTGLHMNISVPVSEVDYVKLILFMGDQYILDLFGRAANSYTRSAFEKIRDKARYARSKIKEEVRQSRPGVYSGDVDIAAAMKLMRANLIELAGRYLQGGVGGDKYTSAHVKQAGDGTYVEFRSPGNDWLDDSDTVNQALTTMLRFARSMTIAGQPWAERREYAKKMYKLLAGYRGSETSRSGQDSKYKTRVEYEGDEKTMDQLFAQYATGVISGTELKREWAERVLSREQDQDNDDDTIEYDRTATQYEIFDRATGKVIDVVRANTDQDALDLANTKYSGQGINYGVRRKAAEPKIKTPASRRAELAKRVTRSTRDVGEQLWRVNHHSSVQWITARSQAEAIEKAIQQDRTFDDAATRARIATDQEKNYYELDQQREIERRQRWSTNQPQGEWTGGWLIKDAQGRVLHRFHGIGNVQADANRHAMTWLQQNPRHMQTGVEVVPEMQ